MFPRCRIHPLTDPQSAAEEGALFHRPADGSADHPVCVWDVPSALYEDDLPFTHDHFNSNKVSHSFYIRATSLHLQ